MRRPSANKTQMIFFFAGLISIFAILLAIRSLFVSVILSFVVYFLLAPTCDYLERKGLSRLLAVAVPFVALISLAGLFVSLSLPSFVEQFASLKTQMPRYIEGTQHFIKITQVQLSSALSAFDLESYVQNLDTKIAGLGQELFKVLPDYLSASLTVILLTPLISFYLLLDGRETMRKILTLVPNNLFELFLNLNYQISTQIGGFIRARLLETAIVTFVVWVGFLIIDFPYALVLAILAGVLNLVPYIGPFIAAAPAFVIALVNGGSSEVLWGLVIVYSVAQVVDMVLIVPFVVAKIVNLHPITVIVSVILGSQIMGVLGMLICIPVASVIKVTTYSIYRHLTGYQP